MHKVKYNTIFIDRMDNKMIRFFLVDNKKIIIIKINIKNAYNIQEN